MEEHGELMTVKEVAEFLKVSPATVRRYIERGRLTPVNDVDRRLVERPKAWKFRRADVEALLNPPKS